MKFELEIVKFNVADVITTSPDTCADDYTMPDDEL